ncbi:MAG: putative lipopolysaccharide heptosyltransferase III [Verrucomicrobiales bacterium]|jgi:predicted lipopolysaccharide heptosyltransferase III
MPEHILVLQLKRIGDAILTAPAIALLRERFPEAHLTLILSGATAQLSDAFCDADEVLKYRPGGHNFKIWRMLALGRYDVCLDFSGNDRAALMTRLSGARQRLGYAKFANGNRLRCAAYTQLSEASVRDLHTVDFHLALARIATGEMNTRSKRSGFAIPSTADGAMQKTKAAVGERYVVIHPGTARKEKYWPADRWAAVIDHLHAHHSLPCVITGSPDDTEEAAHLQEIEVRATAKPHNVAGELSLLDVAAVIGGATLALGVDSAAMHLAAMLERPQIVLFGPTNPFHWRPRHENASLLLAGDESLNVNTFQPKHKSSPMTDLSTNQVCRAIDARLAGQ